MNRLTHKEPNGNWHIEGIDFKSISDHEYGCLCKLLHYEETGYNPDFLDTLPDILEDLMNILKQLPSSTSTVKAKQIVNNLLKVKESADK
jgi:hypothetical protein